MQKNILLYKKSYYNKIHKMLLTFETALSSTFAEFFPPHLNPHWLTNAAEVRAILTSHAKSKIPPESGIFFMNL